MRKKPSRLDLNPWSPIAGLGSQRSCDMLTFSLSARREAEQQMSNHGQILTTSIVETFPIHPYLDVIKKRSKPQKSDTFVPPSNWRRWDKLTRYDWGKIQMPLTMAEMSFSVGLSLPTIRCVVSVDRCRSREKVTFIHVLRVSHSLQRKWNPNYLNSSLK